MAEAGAHFDSACHECEERRRAGCHVWPPVKRAAPTLATFQVVFRPRKSLSRATVAPQAGHALRPARSPCSPVASRGVIVGPVPGPLFSPAQKALPSGGDLMAKAGKSPMAA